MVKGRTRIPNGESAIKAVEPPVPRRALVIPLLTVEARLKRTLRSHLRQLGFKRTEEGGLAPPDCSKESFRQLHRAQIRERLRAERHFIVRQWALLRDHFADGCEVDPSGVAPRLELIQADTWQSNLFRLAALTWSVPVSQGYGRRMRFLVWDGRNNKLVGLIALADQGQLAETRSLISRRPVGSCWAMPGLSRAVKRQEWTSRD